ncbi:MAG: WecB/TagA/CpsF family glycosyltransferase [Clostridiaceae bacterium]
MRKILGYNIFCDTKKSLLDNIKQCNSKLHIVSGNPEVLTNGLNNKDLFENFTSKNSVIIPDGVGVVIASKMVKEPVKEKIAGIEVFKDILDYCNESNKGVYLLGARDEILVKCVNNIKSQYKELNICGYRNGFFDLENCNDLISDISDKKPYAIFVAMGSPRQEKFIAKYMEVLDVNIFMGVGGSFDVFSGESKRAPRWMIKLGLEWLYRVAKEPFRIKRLGVIPKFLMKVARER